VDVNHVVITKKFEEEISSVVKGVLKRQPTKKTHKVFSNAIQKKIWCKIYFQKEWCATKTIHARPCPFGCKNHLLFNLCIVYGWNILQCIYVVQELCFL